MADSLKEMVIDGLTLAEAQVRIGTCLTWTMLAIGRLKIIEISSAINEAVGAGDPQA